MYYFAQKLLALFAYIFLVMAFVAFTYGVWNVFVGAEILSIIVGFSTSAVFFCCFHSMKTNVKLLVVAEELEETGNSLSTNL